MENLYYNLSQEEFSTGRKLLLWGFAGLFFLAGVYILLISLVFGHKSITPVLSIAPFGISIVVSIIAALATIKRKDLFFLIDNDKIEFRYGIFKPGLTGQKRMTLDWILIPPVSLIPWQKMVLPFQAKTRSNGNSGLSMSGGAGR